MWREKSLNNYLNKLASKSPTPGGGSAAALLGALAAGLVSMVANFTLGKPEYKTEEKSVGRILERAEKLRERLSRLTDEDCLAYRKISDTYHLPKGEERNKVMQKALCQASRVPFEVANLSSKLLKLNQDLVKKGNRNLISDVGVSVIFALAALETAALNVEINLAGIKNQKFVTQKRKKISCLLKEGRKIEKDVKKEVKKRS